MPIALLLANGWNGGDLNYFSILQDLTPSKPISIIKDKKRKRIFYFPFLAVLSTSPKSLYLNIFWKSQRQLLLSERLTDLTKNIGSLIFQHLSPSFSLIAKFSNFHSGGRRIYWSERIQGESESIEKVRRSLVAVLWALVYLISHFFIIISISSPMLPWFEKLPI